MKMRFYVVAFVSTLIAGAAFAQSSDLNITKTGPAISAAGTDVTFTITVTNGGPDDSSAVDMQDNITGGWTFVSLDSTGATGFGCTDPGAGNAGLVDCSNGGGLTNGSSATFLLTLHIPPATPPGTFFTNVATVSCATDPDDENNSATAVTSTPPPPTADLGVQKNGPPTSQAADTDVTFNITLTNSGPDDAAGVSMSDTLPGTMTFVSFNQNSGPTMSCSGGATSTCTAALFTAGSTATFTLVGHIPPGTPSGTTFTNTVNVTSNTFDPDTGNNTALAAVSVASADLGITKSAPASAVSGTNVAYTIAINNAGPDASQAVNWSDTLPPGATFVSLIQNNGPAAPCSVPPIGSPGTVTCSYALLNNGASAQWTLTVQSAGTGSMTNSATIGSSETGDPNTNNNTSSATTTLTLSSDIAMTKSGPATAAPGTDVTYNVSITNNGPSVAPNASVTDVLPANTTFVSAVQNTGPTFNCTLPAVGGTGTISCTSANFPAGGVSTFTFVLHIAPAAPNGSVITNSASGAPGAGATDPNSTNDDASVSTTVVAAPTDVQVVKTAPAGLFFTTVPITFTIVVTNNGPAVASAVTLTDPLPPNTTFNSVNTTQGNCTGGSPTTCNIGALLAGGSATITLTVTPTATGPLTNTATVSEANTDTNPANNTSNATVTVADVGTIPALSPLALAMLGLMLAGFALLAMRR